MKTLQFKWIFVMLLGCLSVHAQQKLTKFTKTVAADNEVNIDLNTSYTNIEIDTWNKDQVEVEAYIEGEKISKEALESALKNWNVTVSGSGDRVTITSKGPDNAWDVMGDHTFYMDTDAMRELELELANLKLDLAGLPEMPALPELPNLPEIPEMPAMPELPELPELPDGIGAVHFDYDAYKKEGEAYLERWSKHYENEYGKVYREQMKEWGRKFGETDFAAYSKAMEQWGEKLGKDYGEKFENEYGKKMEAWGREFGEQWGKDYAKRMEAWGERFEKQMEQRSKDLAKRHELMKDRHEQAEQRHAEIAKHIENKANTKIKKTIRIKMPKKAKLNMNVRHGELKFASVIYNVRGNVSHSALTATNIDGSQTSINVSYSPVLIGHWNVGALELNFVDKAQIANVNRLVLHSNSSNVDINGLSGDAAIEGSFGALLVNGILPSFKHLNLALENSEAVVVLPKTNYNLQYKGSRSKLKHPKNETVSIPTFSTGDVASGKSIMVNAKFSEVTMQ